MDSGKEKNPSVKAGASKKSKKRKGRRNLQDETKRPKLPDDQEESPEAAQKDQKAKPAKQRPERKSPTWFLGIPVSNPEIHLGIKQAQQRIVDDSPELAQSAVAVSKSHITLFVFNLDDGDIQGTKGAV